MLCSLPPNNNNNNNQWNTQVTSIGTNWQAGWDKRIIVTTHNIYRYLLGAATVQPVAGHTVRFLVQRVGIRVCQSARCRWPRQTANGWLLPGCCWFIGCVQIFISWSQNVLLDAARCVPISSTIPHIFNPHCSQIDLLCIISFRRHPAAAYISDGVSCIVRKTMKKAEKGQSGPPTWSACFRPS